MSSSVNDEGKQINRMVFLKADRTDFVISRY
jgi:hypothetical protein